MTTGFTVADSMRASSDRGLPWWVGTGADQPGTFITRPGLATVEEALAEGGLDFDVELRPLLVRQKGRHGPLQKVATHKAVVRTDSEDVLGVVGNRYQPIQYRDGLGDFGRALLATDEASVETAMTMYGGRIGVMSFELGHLKGVHIAGTPDEDLLRVFLLLSSSHDGSMTNRADITPVRTVCSNTLNMAIGKSQATFRIRHSGSVEGKMSEARRALGLTIDYMERFEALAQELQLKRVVDDQVAGIMERVWPLPEKELSEKRLEKHNATQATDLYFRSETLEGVRGTAWGVLNAVAEYVDHELPYAGRTNEGGDVRASAILWGRGARTKDKALEVVRAL